MRAEPEIRISYFGLTFGFLISFHAFHAFHLAGGGEMNEIRINEQIDSFLAWFDQPGDARLIEPR